MSDATNRLAQAIADLLAEVASHRPPAARPTSPSSWRERLWSCPADTRLGVAELCEALGRSKAWAYRLTRKKLIPHRVMDGLLVFRAGDIREWLARHEDLHVTPRLTVTHR